ncbi:MAG: hypothetical protein QM647_08900 [Asticcacaulis sp.]|uniref:hypothetical protein n=1 Tax=Asticcacaulis sp. TaxID=1872648 RepID=UPI0039E25E0C
MTTERTIETFIIDWQGITLSVTYEANWMNCKRPGYAHLQIESITPRRMPLPITETGYRSHFIHPSAVVELDGPVAYVLAWLDATANAPEWREAQDHRRQLSLF